MEAVKVFGEGKLTERRFVRLVSLIKARQQERAS